ncbi:MAG: MFS transporter [Xanthobacteraceae bacterium]|nr:MFS transporter [Xanthobacteraceae bacterium]
MGGDEFNQGGTSALRPALRAGGPNASGNRGTSGTTGAITTDVPSRLDRLPWTRFHVRIVVALGVTWILDGLEVTMVGAIGPVLQNAGTLRFSSADIGAVASFYVVGAVAGALTFAWITDRRGRRWVFFATLAIYISGVLLTAVSWNFWSFALFRVITGLGIGGEYAAVNSAIDELMPSKYRGRVDIIVNGSFWLGAAAGAAATPVLLDPSLLPVDVGWRLGFAIGGVLGLSILLLRRHVPESPRWLVTHGRLDEAERTLAAVEQEVAAEAGAHLKDPDQGITIHLRTSFPLREIVASMLGEHRARSCLALVLMISQAFLYNSVFFTYGLILHSFYGVPEQRIGLYVLPLALGNYCGPLALGALFDTVGRRTMIAGTFGVSGLLLFATAALFSMGELSALTQTIAWVLIFFFASAAASSAYLTASEIFPLESRALAIAMFYAAGTAIGGSLSPLLFGWLIGTGQSINVSIGYAIAAALLIAAAGTEWRFGIDAEGASLESIAPPLSRTPAAGRT